MIEIERVSRWQADQLAEAWDTIDALKQQNDSLVRLLCFLLVRLEDDRRVV